MMVKDHSNFNYFHFLVMIHLLSNGGKDSYLEITSTQISRLINRSQQTASKILIDLEKEDLIERVKNKKKFGISVDVKVINIEYKANWLGTNNINSR